MTAEIKDTKASAQTHSEENAPHSQFQTLLWVTWGLYLLAATAAQVYLGYTAPGAPAQGCPSKAGSCWEGLGRDSLSQNKGQPPLLSPKELICLRQPVKRGL